MYARVRELLTSEERKTYMSIPNELDEWTLGTYFTLSQHDLDVTLRHRRDYNRLGFAVQLCIIRFSGWTLSDMDEIPSTAISYIAKQIKVDPNEFLMYSKREATKYEHLVEIRKEYGYRTFTSSEYRQLARIRFDDAMANGNPTHLIQTAIQILRKWKVILPGMATIERVVWETRKRTEQQIFQHFNSSLTSFQLEKLDRLLLPMPDNSGKTYLSWLREIPGQSSPEAFLKVIERLEYIKTLQLNVATETIHPNRLRQLSKIGARYEPHSFRRFIKEKRYAILVAYLLHLSQDLIDQAFEIHDRQIMTLQAKGRRAQDELQKKNGKSVNEKVIHYARLGEALIKAREEGLDPFTTLETIMPWEKFITSIEEAKDLSRPMNYDYLDLLENRFFYLRKYTPTLLKALEFRSTKSTQPLMKALDTIREMNESNKRKVPEGAPLDFVSNRWQKHIYEEDGTINRHYYEMAALTELRNHVRSGDISIVGSRQHKDFEDYLVSKKEWDSASTTGATRLAVNLSVDNYLEERKNSLLKRLQLIKENIHDLEGVNFANGKLHIHRLEKDVPEKARPFSASLYRMLPHIKLTNLLMEVSNWTGFDKEFIHTSTGKPPHPEEKPMILAALMGMGTNIGLTKMAEATPGITYRQMANVAQWRMDEDALNRAQATLVNFHHKMSLSSFWGDGSTSSSDGMRVQVGVSSLHADANPHYGSGKGATIYRFTSDQFSSFYTKVINTNARDAVHVIDGLLHHETDLNIEEHFTDTAGYTDSVFGLSHLLGFRFAPRLRDLTDSKLYTLDVMGNFQEIHTLFRGKINAKIIRDNFDDVLRLAHSIREGTVSGSLIMGKLGSYARQNKISMTLREIGRIEKTIFILDYVLNESLRRRVQRGLNKGEAMNALARAIFFGKHGELRERSLQDQLQRASALNIIINAISLWNTVYLTEATNQLKQNEELDENLLPHVSPLAWEHINFLGEYKFDSITKTSLHSLPSLNITKAGLPLA
ncbi:TPA: Tn3 family transposase [Bacillus mycoides]|uniref:Tn3 family transposase n=1 Tax=Bacillus sp. FSL P2-0099 TaxID=2921572 RepID=UPI0030FBD7FF|nr:Tn3 family transposase [Bacillus mycoides]